MRIAIQLREVLFHMRMVWSSDADSCNGVRCQAEMRWNIGDYTHNPRHFVMKLNRTDEVKVAMQREEAASVGRLDVYDS